MNQLNIIIFIDDAGVIKNYKLLETTQFNQYQDKEIESIYCTDGNDKVHGTCKKCLEPFEVFLYGTKFNESAKEEEAIEFLDELVDDLNIETKKLQEDSPQKNNEGRRKRKSGDDKKEKQTKKYEQPSICEHCGKYFNAMKNMFAHLSSHTKRKDFECHHCLKKFKTKRHIRQHMLKNHITGIDPNDPKFKFVCTMCNPPKRFPSNTALKTHSYSHNDEKLFPCPYCNRKLKCENNVKFHIYKFHTNPSEQKIFRCEKCPYQTVVKSLYQSHQWSHVPSSEKPFKCSFPECGKGFPSQFSVRKHERIHTGVKAFVCQTCGNKFGAKSELKDHMRLHTGEKPYECHVCFARFGDRKRYRQHMLGHESVMGVILDKSLRKFDPTFALKTSNSSS